MEKNIFDVLIIGGSYAGLSAAMTLGRAIRKVLVVDAGEPCNAASPASHNFLTRDGENPLEIAAIGLEQVKAYPTVEHLNGKVQRIWKADELFYAELSTGEQFEAKRILLATGMKDILPDIEGFKACWGKTILHCPYCHGYEVKGRRTGILAKGEYGYNMALMLFNWTKELVIYTNGPHEFSEEHLQKLRANSITIIDKVIEALEHDDGNIKAIRFKDGEQSEEHLLYARVEYEQSSDIAEQLGCKLTETGHLFIEAAQETSVKGVYAAGDNNSIARSVSLAIGEGTKAGLAINADLVEEEF